jgi:hypothetical protein
VGGPDVMGWLSCLVANGPWMFSYCIKCGLSAVVWEEVIMLSTYSPLVSFQGGMEYFFSACCNTTNLYSLPIPMMCIDIVW